MGSAINNRTVYYEATPNPQTMKFYVAEPFTSDTAQFLAATETQRSPLAKKIFGFPWAAGVLIGPNFLTVTKQEWVEWDILAEPLSGLIQEHLDSGEAILMPASSDAQKADLDDSANDSSEVQLIKQILRDEIRPAVAMDGGDIVFDRFEDGRVYLHMKGSCSGCPSSTYTLKEGIETRLKTALPQIVEVVSV